MVYLVIIGAYLLAMVIIGVATRRIAKGADDFFVAGRKGSPLFITGSLLATIIGGSATIGMAGLGFSRGLTGGWWLLVGSIGLAVLGFLFARKVREMGVYTLPGLIQKQYGKKVALAASILIVCAWMGVIAGQIIAAGQIMGVLSTGSPQLWMWIFTAIFVFYTLLGGQHAVIRTDLLQAVLIFIGIFAGLGLIIGRFGSLGGMLGSIPAAKLSFPTGPSFGGYELFSTLFLVGLTYVVGPDMYSRILCARDVRVARRTVFGTALLLIPFAFGVTLIGMGAATLFPQIRPEQAFPTIVREVLPPFAGSLVLAALLAAVMSSADTTLLSASTILTVDIFGALSPSLNKERLVPITRVVVLVLGLISLLLALRLQGVISSLMFAYTIYTAGVTLPVIAGFYREKLRVTPAGALAAIVVGGGTALASKLIGIKYLDLGALGISVVVLLLVSWADILLRGRERKHERELVDSVTGRK